MVAQVEVRDRQLEEKKRTKLPTVDEMRERVMSDRQLTEGQRDQALRFLVYTPGKGRGRNATDPIYKLSGVQICLRYLEVIERYRNNIAGLSNCSISQSRPLGGKSGIIRFRKGKGRPAITQKVTLKSQIIKEITWLRHLKDDSNAGFTLNQIVALFPDRTQHAVMSCLCKAVNQGHLKYNFRTGLYHL